MSLLITGTGALACLFAARLAGAGHAVTMMGSWPEGLAALRKEGVTLHGLDGRHQVQAVRVMEQPTDDDTFKYALVLVKAWQTERAARQLVECLTGDGLALTLQNGLGNAEVLGHQLGAERVALGVTMLGARMLEPGHVQHTGNGKIYLGEHPRLNELRSMLVEAGFEVESVADTNSVLWGKLVINAAINPLTALLRVPNGALLERAAAHEVMRGAAQEAALVARFQGITLPYPDPVLAAEDVAEATGANYSSMLQDVLRGTTTEIESINGEIVRAGERLGAATPINRVLWQLVSSLHINP